MELFFGTFFWIIFRMTPHCFFMWHNWFQPLNIPTEIYTCIDFFVSQGSNFLGSKVLENQSRPEDTRQKLLHIMAEITPRGYWYMCYRGSDNGFSSHSFHHKCDKKGPTVTIARSDDEIFGGYTDQSFDRKTLSLWIHEMLHVIPLGYALVNKGSDLIPAYAGQLLYTSIESTTSRAWCRKVSILGLGP